MLLLRTTLKLLAFTMLLGAVAPGEAAAFSRELPREDDSEIVR